MKSYEIFSHVPILFDEVKKYIRENTIKSVIDCTFGAGGHSELFLKLGCNVIAMDYDEKVLSRVEELREKYDNFTFKQDNFKNIHRILENNSVDLIFGDLGLSSMQLDFGDGFSFRRDSNLFMKSDSSIHSSLIQKLSKLSEYSFADILKKYGEIRNSRLYARRILHAIQCDDLKTTYDLIRVIKIFNKREIAKVFQALRIYHNQEIKNLNMLLNSIIQFRKNFLIIGFHSLELRPLKNLAKKYHIYGKIRPGKEEISQNSRSSSAIMWYGRDFK